MISMEPPRTSSGPSRVIDGWMDDIRFYVLLTVFQSYQDDGRLIMKGYVQWNSVTRVIKRTRYHDKNLQRGKIPLKYRWHYGTVVSEHRPIMQCICTKFRENISKRVLLSGNEIMTKFYKRA